MPAHVLPGLIEDAPMYRAVIEFGMPVKSATAFTTSTELRRRRRRVEAPIDDVHEVLVAGY